jgi:excisionase family DNA binding protein
LNLRPLGPEPAPGRVHAVAGVGKPSQTLDDIQVERSGRVEDLSPDPPNGTDGTAPSNPLAAELRRTEYLRPEDLLPVRVVAQRLGASVATVHNHINAGRLRYVLFGSVRRVRPEDFEAYLRVRASHPSR